MRTTVAEQGQHVGFVAMLINKDIESSISRNLILCELKFFSPITKCEKNIFAKFISRENKGKYGIYNCSLSKTNSSCVIPTSHVVY